MTTAASLALASCHDCGLVSAARLGRCPRCRAALHLRKVDSLARTWACLAAAALLYVPANVLPVMTVTYFGAGEPDTILSGVRVLFATGQPAVAVLVLFASITVPLVKILGLAWLALSVQRRSTWRARDRTRFYLLVEAIGRWSMLDIFMISILVALVKLGEICTIEAGMGATCFAAVVVLTMFAAWSFDPRLIWDAQGGRR